ncbi:MAG: tetraacyldisaccharide 4'-kinase [Leptospiraceae bacterium]|nr:tetraacyldisaccharide 4'-kinase [Leptospiraceae bacterium]
MKDSRDPRILERFYRFGDRVNKWIKRARVVDHAKVVSIGNITTGGTGKTPAAIYFARLLQSESYKIGVLSRGYGGTAMKEGGVLSDGKQLKLGHRESGDEPYLIAANLPGVPVAVGRSRYLSAVELRDNYDCNLFLLDDGFQHYALARDVDIVLIDAMNPFGNGHTLPHGILREPIEALKRSDIVILTKTKLAESTEIQQTVARISDMSGHQLVFMSNHEPTGLVQIPSEYKIGSKLKLQKTSILNSETVWALSAIGSHRSFEKSLYQLGAAKVKSITYRDHYQYNEKDIENLLKRVSPYDFVITTEKDWVKLREFSPALEKLKNFFFLKIEFKILANEILLKEGLKAKIIAGSMHQTR